MRIHAVVSQANGVIRVTLQAQFVGDNTDLTDKQKIAAFGDPLVNIAGSFIDPNSISSPPFSFQFPQTELYVGITTQMSSYTAQFMEVLPMAPSQPGFPPPTQGPLDCITPNPSEAAQAWALVIGGAGTGRIAQAMSALRMQMLLPTIPDQTI